VMEVSTVFPKRKSGKSFIKKGLKYPSIVLPTMLRMYIHFKPLRFFLTIGLSCLILGIIAALYIIIKDQTTFFGDATVTILIIVGFQIVFFGLLADQISYRRK
jgi:hypothetical protein